MTPLGWAFKKFVGWAAAPMPVARLEIVRVIAPLAALGFMSGRAMYAGEWIGDAGFRVPHLPTVAAQPLWIPGLPVDLAWFLVFVMFTSGLMVSAGYRTRPAALVFASTLVFVGLSDRASAFTVSKISPVIMMVIACGPSGSRFGVDAWARAKRGEPAAPAVLPLAPIRFLQVFLSLFYCSSGIAKGGSDWLTTPLTVWSHLHDSYQTDAALLLAKTLPAFAWPQIQYMVLFFELFAPVLFAVSWLRPVGLAFGLMLHTMIAIMFGPVIWFAFLMMSMLLGCFLPERWVVRLDLAAQRLLRPPPATLPEGLPAT